MFNFLKKKTPIGNFFSRLSDNERKAIIATLTILSACDGDSDEQGSELMYIGFYCRHLNVDENTVLSMVKKNGLYNTVQTLVGLTEIEKAALVFMLRGMANIDSPANKHELALLSDISKQLKFDLDEFYSRIQRNGDEKSQDKIRDFFKPIIFPNGNADIDTGANIINHLAEKKLDHEAARNIYINLVVNYELFEVRNLEALTKEIMALGELEISEENTDKLFKFFRGSILGRLEKVVFQKK